MSDSHLLCDAQCITLNGRVLVACAYWEGSGPV